MREINLCTLITVMMKTALYKKIFKKTLNQLKLVKLTKNTISQSLLRIRFSSRCNVTLFMFVSLISCILLQ